MTKCPKCGYKNRAGVGLCGGCGQSPKTELTCPQCGHSNLQDSKFCDKCNQDLTVPSEQLPRDLSFDEKPEKIQRYLPGGLTDKILAQRDKIEGERKQVTVIFCNMKIQPFLEQARKHK